MSRLMAFCVLGALLSLCGCQRGATLYPVSGAVTFKGTPLAEGSIIFEPDDPANAQSKAGTIKDGHYTIPASEGLAPGHYKVRITAIDPATKPTTTELGPDGLPVADRVAQQIVPRQYNTQTTLTCDVTADKKEFDFKLD